MYDVFIPSAICRFPWVEMAVATVLTLVFVFITKPPERP